MASKKCRACGRESVATFLSFGKLPLGNAFLTAQQIPTEELFELDLGFCTNCSLVQQTTPPPTSSLARVYQNYRYVPVGGSLRNNLASLSRSIVADFHLDKKSLFIDIGSNDGALLAGVRGLCKVLGIEPATEISELARKAGIETITSFFTHDLAEEVVSKYGNADAVSATQVLQHIPDPQQFVKDVRLLLKPDGIFVIEGRYFADTIRKSSFDTVYHEMLSFFTLSSLVALLRPVGMEAFRAQFVDVYGGSLRIYAKKTENQDIQIEESVSRILETERDLGLHDLNTYEAFARRVVELRDRLHNLVVKLSAEGRIAGYGAPSTGTTLLSYCRIGNDRVDFIVDDSPLKQGLLTPGTHIPIVDSTVLAKKPPDYLLLIAWRLRNEILPKIKDLQARGMSVVIPLPELEVVKGSPQTTDYQVISS